VASYAAGLHGMTRNLALDLKPIRVNLVSPGAVDTELWKDFTQEQKKGFFKSISERVPTGRIGKRKFLLTIFVLMRMDIG
jgi:NAD(P)-dependent dehydrogenase (short-subunit alcohol dehydrogenase family)